MKTQTVTIDKIHNEIVARDEAGNVLARRKTYCNPAALSQLLLDVKMLDAEIDWSASQVAKPETE